jgi:hypothetical protein
MVRPESETFSLNSASRQQPRKSWPVAIAKLSLALLLVALYSIAGCDGCSSLPGTYTDPQGAITLDIKSGGTATLTFMGETAQCTYTVDGKKLALNCKGDAGKLTFNIQDDGSLTGPPGTFIPPLRKKK